ncbi:MAG: tetraacyldisaccharide 4'-kinase, partial [Planctomycetota bacterium]
MRRSKPGCRPRFEKTLVGLGATVCGRAFFGDHHAYSVEEIGEVIESARSTGADFIVTTEKDEPKLRALRL